MQFRSIPCSVLNRLRIIARADFSLYSNRGICPQIFTAILAYVIHGIYLVKSHDPNKEVLQEYKELVEIRRTTN